MVAFIFACLLGVSGHGIFSEWTGANADRTIAIQYDRVVRFGAATEITLDTKLDFGHSCGLAQGVGPWRWQGEALFRSVPPACGHHQTLLAP